MAETAHVLTRENSIPNLITPTGRQLGVRAWPKNPGLYEVVYVDGKPGSLPDTLAGHHFTKKDIAIHHIKKYLTEFWDTSDSKKK